jgi:hypothetical protein
MDLWTASEHELATLKGRLPFEDREFGRLAARTQESQDTDQGSRRDALNVQWMSMVRAHTPNGTLDSVLHLGCGAGGFVRSMPPETRSYTGVDINIWALRMARQQNSQIANIRFLRLDLLSSIGKRLTATPHSCALFPYEVLNQFAPCELPAVLTNARNAISLDGRIACEVRSVQTAAVAGRTTMDNVLASSPFLDTPHRLIVESRFNSNAGAFVERIHVSARGVRRRYTVVTWLYDFCRFEKAALRVGLKVDAVCFLDSPLQTDNPFTSDNPTYILVAR